MNELLEPSALPVVSRPIAYYLTIADPNATADGNDEHDAKLSTSNPTNDAEYANYTAKNRASF